MFLVLLDVFLINLGFIAGFLLRYRGFPDRSFTPYRESWIWLTLLFLSSLMVFGAYNHRFRSSWVLFTKVTKGIIIGTAASIIFIYIFRIKWNAFPTSVFLIATAINILLIFKTNQYYLKLKGRIGKNVVIIGKGKPKGLPGKINLIKQIDIKDCTQLEFDFKEINQIIITDEIQDVVTLEYLTLISQKFNIDIVFAPTVYMKLVSKRINGDNKLMYLKTFQGQLRDAEEFLIRVFDIIASIFFLIGFSPLLILIVILIKCTSSGSVIYKQVRVGKDGRHFVIYKFRTMYQDSEKLNGFRPAEIGDERITKIGYHLRRFRLDEIPQFINILKHDMSLVGPRPENVYRVNSHKALQGIRLSVKPGLTGLAQIRSLYDLKPRHKIKYDYLYIQRRSFLLNLYIILNTLPVLFSKRGW